MITRILHKEAIEITESKDYSVQQNLKELLTILINKYGVGYDSVKTLTGIKEMLKEDLELLEECK
jgi:hypothetical protein